MLYSKITFILGGGGGGQLYNIHFDKVTLKTRTFDPSFFYDNPFFRLHAVDFINKKFSYHITVSIFVPIRSTVNFI